MCAHAEAHHCGVAWRVVHSKSIQFFSKSLSGYGISLPFCDAFRTLLNGREL